MINGLNKIPKYVKTEKYGRATVFRLTDELTYCKDAGGWEVDAEIFPDGTIISKCENMAHLDGMEMKIATEREYVVDNVHHLYEPKSYYKCLEEKTVTTYELVKELDYNYIPL
jgi:hypothetical protein